MTVVSVPAPVNQSIARASAWARNTMAIKPFTPRLLRYQWIFAPGKRRTFTICIRFWNLIRTWRLLSGLAAADEAVAASSATELLFS